MFRRLALVAALLLCGTPAYAGALFPYGLYVGNPNGNDPAAMAKFQADWDASVKQLRRQPAFFGAFVDYG